MPRRTRTARGRRDRDARARQRRPARPASVRPDRLESARLAWNVALAVAAVEPTEPRSQVHTSVDLNSARPIATDPACGWATMIYRPWPCISRPCARGSMDLLMRQPWRSSVRTLVPNRGYGASSGGPKRAGHANRGVQPVARLWSDRGTRSDAIATATD